MGTVSKIMGEFKEIEKIANEQNKLIGKIVSDVAKISESAKITTNLSSKKVNAICNGTNKQITAIFDRCIRDLKKIVTDEPIAESTEQPKA